MVTYIERIQGKSTSRKKYQVEYGTFSLGIIGKSTIIFQYYQEKVPYGVSVMFDAIQGVDFK